MIDGGGLKRKSPDDQPQDWLTDPADGSILANPAQDWLTGEQLLAASSWLTGR